ncbi:MAG: YHS domain-containing (seleno)protein [Leptolyngbyaceae cyanobacterium MO_188.B28]|nr:YHS domain-containing (seleno)protein [Leptolyngbyaceae cyanobacterium MO_188.B28]
MTHLQNLNELGIALQGYDPVSYFSNQPVKGDSEISTTYNGATYLFSSKSHKATFDATPQQFIPQYGGFCAVAVSEGKTFPIDPNTYTISDSKLYLF